MRYVLFAILALSCVSLFHLRQMEVGTPRLRSEIVMLESTDGRRCTGFIVARGLVVSAGHCMHPADKTPTITFIDGTKRHYKIISYEFQGVGREDWSLVMVDTLKFPALKLEPGIIQARDYITHIGHPGGNEDQYEVPGVVAGVYGPVILLMSYAIQGESGSPILDVNGRVVGIITTTMLPLPVSAGCAIDKAATLVDMLTGAL